MKALVIAALVALIAPAAAWAEGARIVAQDVPLGGRALAGTRPPIRFDLVGLHWRGPGKVLFRTRAEGGRWSAWRSGAPENEDGPDARSPEAARSAGWKVGNPYWTGGSSRIQYRLRGRVQRLRAYFVRSPVSLVPYRTISAATSPRILPRAAWQADERIRRAPPSYAKSIQLALVHHTAGTNNYSRAQSAAIVRGIEVYHVQGNGWNDIAYNFLVDKYGQVFEGRYGGVNRNVIGAHAQGFNTGTVGVSLLGTYGGAAPPQAAQAALQKLLAWRLDVAHVDPLSFLNFVSLGNPRFAAGTPVLLRAVSGHRDVGFTDCPGTVFYRALPTIARGVSRIGLPKIYAPTVRGSLGGAVRFGARLSASLPWTVTIRDAGGAAVAAGSGRGTKVAWSWDSTLVPRKPYSWAIESPRARPARGAVGGRVVQPPVVLLSEVTVSPATVTPNDDGNGDFATIRYRLGADALVTTTFVEAASGITVAPLFSEQKPAGRHSFRFTASALPDGRYRVVVTAQTADGKTATASVPLLVSRLLRAFTLRPTAFSPNGDGRIDRLTFSFELKAATGVRLEARRRGKPVLTVYEAQLEAGRHRVNWDGLVAGVRAPDGGYTAAARVLDASSAVALTQHFVLDTKPPRLSLVSVTPLRLRVDERATLIVSARGGRSWLRSRVGVVKLRERLRGARIVAQDAAGNRTKPLRIP